MPLLNTVSRASSYALSKANNAVPEPAPGSLVPQKNSAPVTLMSRSVNEFSMLTAFLYKGPQFPSSSFTRILNKWIPLVEGNEIPAFITSSTASSKEPSEADIAVPLPAPGSVVPQKNSADVTTCADRDTDNSHNAIAKTLFITKQVSPD